MGEGFCLGGVSEEIIFMLSAHCVTWKFHFRLIYFPFFIFRKNPTSMLDITPSSEFGPKLSEFERENLWLELDNLGRIPFFLVGGGLNKSGVCQKEGYTC